jgi:acetoin utilization deacetylase AcuC-like enzyme
MKVVTSKRFDPEYTWDPAAEAGRMEAVRAHIDDLAEYVEARPATREALRAAHGRRYVAGLMQQSVAEVACLAAGGAIQAAEIGLAEPCFGLVRPPGHHASADSAWGFCYLNNMAIALLAIQGAGRIRTAYVLDIDVHYGDGTVHILGSRRWVMVHNVDGFHSRSYLAEVREEMEGCRADIIGISAGFDAHVQDWGGILETDDYRVIGRHVRRAADRNGGGCFALFEGGYNHATIGPCARALMLGMMDRDA